MTEPCKHEQKLSDLCGKIIRNIEAEHRQQQIEIDHLKSEVERLKKEKVSE
jgi:hypothetical protein